MSVPNVVVLHLIVVETSHSETKRRTNRLTDKKLLETWLAWLKTINKSKLWRTTWHRSITSVKVK